MEHKDIFALIIAAFGVIVLIGVLGMARGSKAEQEESAPLLTTAVEITSPKTDIWDVLHNQQTTTTEAVMTDESGQTIITDTTGTGLPNESGIVTAETMPGETLPEQTTLSETVPAETVASTAATQPGFTIVVAPN